MKKHLIIILAAALLSSCAGFTNITTPQNVALNQGNFKFIKSVSTSSTAYYVLGIGGLTKKANADIVEKLIEEAQLQPNQALADFRIKTTKKIFLGIIIERELTASASVVEFCNTGANTFSEPKTPNNTTSSGQSVREAKIKRLTEINTSLANGTANDIETIAMEIDDIEQWYNENGYYKPTEWTEVERAKELIRQREPSSPKQ